MGDVKLKTTVVARPMTRYRKTGLGSAPGGSYTEGVSGVLRFVGIVNAAVWLGAGIFFAAFILPAVFSPEMHGVFRVPAGSPSYNYYPGAVAMVLFKRFFALQYLCGTIALVHLLAEKLYLGRVLPRIGLGIVIGVFTLALMGGVWLQPRLKKMHETIYSAPGQEQRELARQTFGRWHGISQLVNVVMLGGLLVHLLQVTRTDDSSRYITFGKFWG